MSNIVVGSDIVQPLTETGTTQHDLVFETTMSSEQFFSLDGLNQFQTTVDRAYMTGKRLIEAGRSPAPALVADPETALKALLAA